VREVCDEFKDFINKTRESLALGLNEVRLLLVT